jgi:hypothetical protein
LTEKPTVVTAMAVGKHFRMETVETQMAHAEVDYHTETELRKAGGDKALG